jgi:hypothetical protein
LLPCYRVPPISPRETLPESGSSCRRRGGSPADADPRNFSNPAGVAMISGTYHGVSGAGPTAALFSPFGTTFSLSGPERGPDEDFRRQRNENHRSAPLSLWDKGADRPPPIRRESGQSRGVTRDHTQNVRHICRLVCLLFRCVETRARRSVQHPSTRFSLRRREREHPVHGRDRAHRERGGGWSGARRRIATPSCLKT